MRVATTNDARGQRTDADGGELFALEAAAEQLCVSRTTLYRMLDRGEIRGVKVGRQWRFRRDDIQTYLSRGPAAMVLTALPVGVIDAEVGYIAGLLARQAVALPVVEGGGMDPGEGKVQQLLQGIVRLAMVQRATDIHLEPAKDDGGELYGWLRFRIDGFLHEIRRMPVRVCEALLVRVRLLATGDVGGGYLDASLHLPLDGAIADFRVSVLPGCLGASLSARLISLADGGPLPLDQLGFHPDDLARARAWMEPGAGVILVNGPSGSGKTALLYRLLELAVGPQRKVVTVEDPVERFLPGVLQVEINPQTRSFGAALRALLRHDADVVMVAELRDLETINLVLQSARLGHLMLAPVYIDRAIEVLHRIREVFPPEQGDEMARVMAQTVRGIVGMRLVRTLCPDCRERHDVPAALRDRLAAWAASTGGEWLVAGDFRRPVGCPRCAGTGFYGRTGIYELVEVTPALREAFLRGASREELARFQHGARTLAAEALRKTAEGLVALDEVLPILERQTALESAE